MGQRAVFWGEKVVGQQRRYGTSRGIIAAALALCVMPAIGGCVARDYAGIPLQPGAAPADLQTLALRARAGDKRAQFELGERYETGDGVVTNINRAMLLYTAAATDRGGFRMIFVPNSNGAINAIPVNIGPLVPGCVEARERLLRLNAIAGQKRSL